MLIFPLSVDSSNHFLIERSGKVFFFLQWCISYLPFSCSHHFQIQDHLSHAFPDMNTVPPTGHFCFMESLNEHPQEMEFSLLCLEESLSNQLQQRSGWYHLISWTFNYKTDLDVLEAWGPFPHLSVCFLEFALLQWESLFNPNNIIWLLNRPILGSRCPTF